MSESSLPLAAAPASGAYGGPDGTALLRSLSTLLSDWLPRQRWFAGKGRPLTGFSLVTVTELLPCTPAARRPGDAGEKGGGGPETGLPGLLHLLVRARQPAPGAAAHATVASGDCYQLLLGVREALPPDLAPALIGRPTRGPLRGRAVYEALHDPRLTGLLLERLRTPGRLGPLRFSCEQGTDLPAGLRSWPLSAEQSNSSVVYGSAYILKLFRRVDPGVNPDLELPLALARQGCARVPAPTAWFEALPSEVPAARTGPAGGAEDGASFTLGVLQPYLPGSRDGWQLALRALAARQDFTPAARALGRATAEVHTGLAEALPTSVLSGGQLERQAAEMAARLDTVAEAVPALRPYRSALRGAYGALAELGRNGRVRPAQRVHGDLHLGQVLCTRPDGAEGAGGEEVSGRGEWSLIDFEGEPARPLAERRADQPVVRDIAGMLRSFDYAACQRPVEAGDTWSHEWASANRAAYCAGYAEASGADPRDDAVLLRAYETDKAVYEVLYEARNRPPWLSVPMSAVRRLARQPNGG